MFPVHKYWNLKDMREEHPGRGNSNYRCSEAGMKLAGSGTVRRPEWKGRVVQGEASWAGGYEARETRSCRAVRQGKVSGTEAGLAPSWGRTWILKEPLAAVWLGSVWEVGGDTARWEPVAESRGCCNRKGNRRR